MFPTKRRQLELENLALKRQLDEKHQASFDTKPVETRGWKIASLLIPAILGLMAAAAAVYGPGWVKQEKLGVATAWDPIQFAGTSAETMPRIGDTFDPVNLKSQGAQAFREGQVLISLTAEKDRNYTFTDIRAVPKETGPLPKASWFYVNPPTTGGGPSIVNIELSLDLDTGTWTNLERNSQLQPGVKFAPFVVASDNPATIRIWVKGSKDQTFSIVLSHQPGGENSIKDAPAGDYVIYGNNESVPHFTSDTGNKFTELPPLSK